MKLTLPGMNKSISSRGNVIKDFIIGLTIICIEQIIMT